LRRENEKSWLFESSNPIFEAKHLLNLAPLFSRGEVDEHRQMRGG
jgi:hypothetical protein